MTAAKSSSRLSSGRRALFLQVCEAGAYPPIINAAHLMNDAGWKVTVLSCPSIDRDMPFPCGPEIDLISLEPRPNYVVQKHQFLEYCWRAQVAARDFRPTLVYASDPLAAIPGMIAASLCRAELVYHEHDSPNAQADLAAPLRWARRRIVHKADALVFPNECRAALARAELSFDPRRQRIVWNVPRRKEVQPFRPHPSPRSIIYYHGSIVPDRLPLTVVEAIAALAPMVELQIAGYETPSGHGFVGFLKERFGEAKAGGLIEYLGPMNRDAVLAAAARADIGLAFMPMESTDVNMRHMAGASNKAFDYMAAGLPFLVSDLPEWRTMFVMPGFALAADPRNRDSVKRQLEQLINDVELRNRQRERCQAMIRDEWNYDTKFGRLLAEFA
jgi:glycosyltransferase involved in cell wall biosynthesis